MTEKCFNQHLDAKEAVQPGGPFMIQMLFKSPVWMPEFVHEYHTNGMKFMALDEKGNVKCPFPVAAKLP